MSTFNVTDKSLVRSFFQQPVETFSVGYFTHEHVKEMVFQSLSCVRFLCLHPVDEETSIFFFFCLVERLNVNSHSNGKTTPERQAVCIKTSGVYSERATSSKLNPQATFCSSLQSGCWFSHCRKLATYINIILQIKLSVGYKSISIILCR